MRYNLRREEKLVRFQGNLPVSKSKKKFVAIIAITLMTTLAAFSVISPIYSPHAFASASYQQGPFNDMFQMASDESTFTVVLQKTTTIQTNNTSGIVTDGCPDDGAGEYSMQLTMVGANSLGFQAGVSVNTQGGDSCFGVTQFAADNVIYCYGFAIGYSSEFYDSGDNVSVTISEDGSGDAYAAYLSVPSDSWVIYQDQLLESSNCNGAAAPSINIQTMPFTFTLNTMPGEASDLNFTAGKGNFQYEGVSQENTCGAFTAEHGDLYYGDIVSGYAYENYYQWFDASPTTIYTC